MRITDITNITGITRRFKGGGIAPPPFIDDTNFDFFARDAGSLTLQDKVAGNDAAFVGGVGGNFDGVSKIPINEINLGGEFEITYLAKYPDNTDTGAVIGSSNTSYTYFGRILSNNFRLQIADSTTQTAVFDWRGDGNWHLVSILVDTTCHLYIDGVEQTQMSCTVDGTLNALVGVIGQFRSIDNSGGFSGLLCCTNLNNQAIYPLNGNAYNTLDGTEAANNGVTFAPVTDYDPPSTQDALDLGYWQNDAGLQVINKALNTTGLVDTTGWTEHEGGKMHNFISSYVEFPVDSIFDRSNTVVYDELGMAQESEYYDSLRPTLWHISELNYDYWNACLNPAYQDRNFEKIETNYGTQLYTDRIFSYANQKTGADLVEVLEYINYVWSGGREWVTNNGEIVYNNDIPVTITP